MARGGVGAGAALLDSGAAGGGVFFISWRATRNAGWGAISLLNLSSPHHDHLARPPRITARVDPPARAAMSPHGAWRESGGIVTLGWHYLVEVIPPADVECERWSLPARDYDVALTLHRAPSPPRRARSRLHRLLPPRRPPRPRRARHGMRPLRPRRPPPPPTRTPGRRARPRRRRIHVAPSVRRRGDGERTQPPTPTRPPVTRAFWSPCATSRTPRPPPSPSLPRRRRSPRRRVSRGVDDDPRARREPRRDAPPRTKRRRRASNRRARAPRRRSYLRRRLRRGRGRVGKRGGWRAERPRNLRGFGGDQPFEARAAGGSTASARGGDFARRRRWRRRWRARMPSRRGARSVRRRTPRRFISWTRRGTRPGRKSKRRTKPTRRRRRRRRRAATRPPLAGRKRKPGGGLVFRAQMDKGVSRAS